MSALGRPQDMFSDTAIQLQPVFAQWIQTIHTVAPQVTAPNALAPTSVTWGGDLVAVGGKVAMMPIPLGTADFPSPPYSCLYDSRDCSDPIERCSLCEKLSVNPGQSKFRFPFPV